MISISKEARQLQTTGTPDSATKVKTQLIIVSVRGASHKSSFIRFRLKFSNLCFRP